MPFSFSTRLNEFNNQNVEPAAADNSVLGHRFHSEMQACAASAAAGTSHKQPLVRGKPGIIWPCRSVRDVSTNTDDAIWTMAPMYLAGHIGGEPVYQAIKTPVTDRQGWFPGSYQWQWPVMIPGVLVTECGGVTATTIHPQDCTNNVNKCK